MSRVSLGERNFNIILRISIIGVFGALCFVLTAFVGIPYAGGQGYFGFGDIITLTAAMVFGPIEGALVGMLGGSLGDLYAGMANFVPFTLIAKCLMGFVTGFLYRGVFKEKKIGLFAPFVGAIPMFATYFVSYYVFYGELAWLSLLFDVIQGFGSAAIAIPLVLALKKPMAAILKS